MANGDDFYAAVVQGDFRQGDIFRDTLSLWAVNAEPVVLRKLDKRGGGVTYNPHDRANPPKDGFKWNVKELVPTEAKLAMAIVLTHDCEIENEDDERYRQVAIVRPLSSVTSEQSREAIVAGKAWGRLYLPPHEAAGMTESFADLRAVTTLRRDGLDGSRRIAGLSDHGRNTLRFAVVAYFTELASPEEPVP